MNKQQAMTDQLTNCRLFIIRTTHH